MAIPVSAEAQFRRLDKILKELKQVENDPSGEEQSIIVADICNACILTLDKATNFVWAAKANKRDGKGKPNIYFPICPSKDKLTTKFQQYQLPSFESESPEIFSTIESVQPYKGVKWFSALQKLAAIRHERYPKIEKRSQGGIGIGRGQDLYIESLVFDGAGRMNFKGHGISRVTGKAEPARIEQVREMLSVLEGVAEDPYDFCSSSVVKVKRLASTLYKLASGEKPLSKW